MKLVSSLCLTWLVVALFAAPLHAGSAVTSPAISIATSSWLENTPQNGYVPIQLEIKNKDKASHSWDVTVLVDSETETHRTVTVPAESSATFDFLALIASNPTTTYVSSSNVFLTVHGYGVEDNAPISVVTSSGRYGPDLTRFVAMSHTLGVLHWGKLKDTIDKGHSHNFLGSEVDMNHAPTDWRAYTGIAQLWLTEDEWNTFTAQTRSAIMDWVALGGELFMMSNDPAVAAHWKYQFGRNGSVPHGNGASTKVPWDGVHFPYEAAKDAIVDSVGPSSVTLAQSEWSHSNFINSMGHTKIRAGLVFSFIVIFGIVVGPLNLLWFAKPPRRHRLFWTTPALSLGGSVLLITLIILQDGTGGAGARVIAVQLLPEDKKMAVFQEQVVRTGVLLSQKFPVREANWMFPVSLTDSHASSYPYKNGANLHLQDNATERSGSWFTSRSIVAHSLQTIRTSRGAVLFSKDPSGAASMVSSISVPLKTVFVVDDQGLIWKAENAGTGERKNMVSSDRDTLATWIRLSRKEGGSLVDATLMTRYFQNGTVYAEAAEPGDFPIESLPSIRWAKQKVFFIGPVTHL